MLWQKIARGSHILHRCSEVGGGLKYFWYFEYGLNFFADTFKMHLFPFKIPLQGILDIFVFREWTLNGV